jgi:hypothetical protein
MGNEVSDALARLWNGDLPTSIALSKIRFGVNPEDCSDLLSFSSFDITYGYNLPDMVQESRRPLHTLSEPNLSAKRFQNAFGIELNSVNVNFEGGNALSAKIDASVSTPIRIDVDIPFFAAKIQLDNVSLLEVGFGMKISSAVSHFTAEVKVAFDRGVLISDKISRLVNAIFTGAHSLGAIQIDGVVLGTSALDKTEAFSKISIDIPIALLFESLHDQLKMFSEHEIHTLLSDLGMIIDGIEFKALQARSVQFDSNIEFHNPFIFSVTGLGFVRVALSIDEQKIATVHLPRGFSIQPGTNKLKLSAKAQFKSSLQVQQKVGLFADHLQSRLGTTEEYLVLSGITFGVDEKSSITLFEKTNIKIPSSYLLTEQVFDIFPKIPSKNDIILNNLALNFKELTKTIGLDVGGTLDASFPLDLDFPQLALKILVDKANGFELSFSGIKIDRTGQFNLISSIAVYDTEELAYKIKSVADAIIEDYSIPSSLEFAGLIFGISSNDFIDAFSHVKVIVPLNDIIPAVSAYSSKISQLKDKLDISLKSVGIQSLPEQTVEVNVKGSFTNGLNLTLSGLGYLGLSLGLDKTDILLVDAAIPDILHGNNNVDLSTNIKFPSSSVIRSKVAQYANDLYTLGAESANSNFTAQSFVFGNSKKNSFKFLSKALLSIKLSDFLTPDFTNSLKSSFDSQFLTLQKVHVNGAAEDFSLLVDLSFIVEEVKMDLNLNIGYASLDIGINDDR